MKKQKKQPAGFASFSDYYDYSKLRKEIGTTGLFLCLFCVVPAIVFFVRGLAAVGAQEILSYVFAGFFLLVLLAYLLFPVKLFQFLWKLRPFTDRVGKYLLRAILLPVYLLFCLFSLPFVGRQRKKYRFAAWTEQAAPEASYYGEDTQNVFQAGSSGRFRFLTSLVGAMAEKQQFFLFPVLLLLLLLGLFFYFISSSSILGFIYTLF